MTEQNYRQQPAVQAPSNGMGVAGLVLGITSVGLCWLFAVGFVLGLVGVILSANGVTVGRRTGAGRGMAIAGLVLSLVGLVLGVLLTLAVALD